MEGFAIASKMDTSKIFDIILPTICRPSLVNTIRSVIDQSHASWFLWVISDGIKYSDAKIDLPFDERIKYLYLPDRYNDSGATPRNVAIEMGNSPYIAYIDDDDMWMTNHLETLSNLLGSEANMARTAGQSMKMRRKHRLTSKTELKLGPINTADIFSIGMCHSRELFLKTNGWNTKDLEAHDKKLWYDMVAAGGIPAISDAVTFRFMR